MAKLEGEEIEMRPWTLLPAGVYVSQLIWREYSVQIQIYADDIERSTPEQLVALIQTRIEEGKISLKDVHDRVQAIEGLAE